MTCPFCKSKNVSYPTVDIGVGEIQCGPAECMDCGAAQVQIYYSTDINAEHTHVEWITFEQRKLDTEND